MTKMWCFTVSGSKHTTDQVQKNERMTDYMLEDDLEREIRQPGSRRSGFYGYFKRGPLSVLWQSQWERKDAKISFLKTHFRRRALQADHHCLEADFFIRKFWPWNYAPRALLQQWYSVHFNKESHLFVKFQRNFVSSFVALPSSKLVVPLQKN